MGVPGLLRWFQKQFPSACKTATRLDVLRSAQSLYIDLNSTLHQGARESNGDVGTISATIDQIVRQINPSSLLFLAIDGVPPRMKERLQRQRRVRSLDSSSQQQKTAGKSSFSSYAITPGTKWMRQVEKHIVDFIEQKRRVDGRWKRLKVVFSGSNDPGEGEQKIMAYLRAQKDAAGGHCVWSNDADTVLLSLAAHVPGITTVSKHGSAGLVSYTIVDIDELACRIATRYAALAGHGDFGGDQLVDQLVFMTFFAGNDFLPPGPFVQAGADAECINALWKTYANLPHEHRCLHSHGIINPQAFKALLRLFISNGEERGFRQHVGVTALGSQLTALRARRMEWTMQSNKYMSSTSGSELYETQQGRGQRKKKSKTGQLVPFVWIGDLMELDQTDWIKHGVEKISGSAPLLAEQRVMYRTTDECLHMRSGEVLLELDRIPLACPSLLPVVRAVMELAANKDVPLYVESLEHIGSSKLKWLPSFANRLQVECKVIYAGDPGYDSEYEQLKAYRAGRGSSLSSENNGLQTVRTTTVVIGELGHLHPPTHFVLLTAQPTSKSFATPQAVDTRVALVSDTDWGMLLSDAKTERKRVKELSKWKTLFYKRHYFKSSDNSDFVHDLCTNYANALGWTTKYYFTGEVSSWEFCWPADIEGSLLGVAPLESDLLEFLDAQGQMECWLNVPVSAALPPMVLEHQLSVLPFEAWSNDDRDMRLLAEMLRDNEYSDELRSEVRRRLIESGNIDGSPCAYFWFY
ncbi:hypothetical protein H4R99_001987 [Coemansia sp. RSA 1722]|nr:hypothetical protein LPJ57_001620 [Coemansia sp. RSA 486]KAJ2235515.1 hypothetical protein IWW45_002532 [Coemansia sp. RSA 485]KAJ2600648.1 hypothetical protein GGF39_001665 [Coemansia sp. RSA 1721]KAJ2604156.1 hypothetical protein H4R99_001987 [Coemansia sp. RSA 1722]